MQMRIVIEQGDIPDPYLIHKVRCRNCRSLYTAQTEDAYKIYNYNGYWELVIFCPCCKTKNIVNVSKPDRKWDKHLEGISRDVEVEVKNYNGTF